MSTNVDEIAEKLTNRIARIKSDCESAVYTTLLRDRIIDLTNIIDALVKVLGKKDVDLTLIDSDLYPPIRMTDVSSIYPQILKETSVEPVTTVINK